ncbi:MAG: hypothetical protein M3Z01_07615 [Thermoproteota archaeon]|nr:hypothetical protein [Thermoproteota archaeon]
MSDNKGKKQKNREKPPPPPLSLEDHYDNILVIKDEELGKTVDVIIRGGLIYCDLHSNDSGIEEENQDCLHIEFVLTLPQIDKLRKSGILLR